MARVEDVGQSNVMTCTIVRGELIHMAYYSGRVAENLERVESFLEDIGIYLVDEETADIYGELKAAVLNHFGPREKSKRRHTTIENLGLNENDLWIAAIALRHHTTIVSADSDFQRLQSVVPLVLENWLTS